MSFFVTIELDERFGKLIKNVVLFGYEIPFPVFPNPLPVDFK